MYIANALRRDMLEAHLAKLATYLANPFSVSTCHSITSFRNVLHTSIVALGMNSRKEWVILAGILH